MLRKVVNRKNLLKALVAAVIICLGLSGTLTWAQEGSPGNKRLWQGRMGRGKAMQKAISAEVSIDAGAVVHRIDPFTFGQQLEFNGQGVDGGIWGELLRNRKFGSPDINGDGVSDPWMPLGIEGGECFEPGGSWPLGGGSFLPVGREKGASFALDSEGAFVGEHCQRITASKEARRAGISQPVLSLGGRDYTGYIYLRGRGAESGVTVSISGRGGGIYAQQRIGSVSTEWKKYEFKLTPALSDPKARFAVFFEGKGTLWIGAVSLMGADNISGLTGSAVKLLKEAGPTLMRYPGGCYAENYHFEQALGPRDKRPMTYDIIWGQWNHNDMGIDEFLVFCKELGAEPYITVNFTTAGPEEAARWVEYTNGVGGTKKTRVRYWSVGNEINLVKGRDYSPEYAKLLPEYVKAMRAVDPGIKIAVVGSSRYDDWNSNVLTAREWFDWLSVHYYYNGLGFGARLDEETLFRSMVGRARAQEKCLRDMSDMLRAKDPQGRVKLIFDEWNVLPSGSEVQVQRWNKRVMREVRRRHSDNALFTLREGLHACVMMHTLFRLGEDILSGANVFSSVNRLGIVKTDGLRSYGTPVYYALKLYRNYSGNRLVSTSTKCSSYTLKKEEVFGSRWNPPPQWQGKFPLEIPYLDTVATLSEDGKRLFVHFINLHVERAIEAKIELKSFAPSDMVYIYTLNGDSLLAFNDYGHPEEVSIVEEEMSLSGGQVSYTIPPHSAVTLEFTRR